MKTKRFAYLQYLGILFRVHLRRIIQIIVIIPRILFRKTTIDGQKIYSLKNIHMNESCIIVGNGPSVKMDDLDSIQSSGIASFGSNRITDIFDKTSWRPKYLCVMDSNVVLGKSARKTPDEYYINAVKNGVEKVLFSNVLKQFVSYKERNIYYSNVFYTPMFSKLLFPFSKKMEYWVSDLGSVTHYAIEFAIYMGYSTIYLYGMDNTYIKYLNNDGKFVVNNSIESHTKGIIKDETDMHLFHVPHSKYEAITISGFADKRKNDIGYLKCKRYADKRKIKIINLTRGGHLDTFERKPFDEVFNK